MSLSLSLSLSLPLSLPFCLSASLPLSLTNKPSPFFLLQPVSVTIDGGGLNNYQGGVLSGQCCNQGYGDHAVLVIGKY